MNFRFIAGILIILAVVIVLPASALPDIGAFPAVSGVKTGTIWVTVKNVNGSGPEEPVRMAYAVGDVAEIDRAFVTEDAKTGVVTVTLSDSDPACQYALVPENGYNNDLYIINSIMTAHDSDQLLSNDQSFAAVPATANYYMDTVPEGKQHEWVDLDWKDADKDLGLTVYAPDATFGPYGDMADGRKDGRIFLDFESLLNVTAGNWFFKVQNDVKSYIPYSLNTYSA